MKYLHESGFSTISLDQLYEAYQGKSMLPEKPIVITFDDGYLDNYTAAFPVLKQYNFTAAFFVITDVVGKGMMSWEQLREMQDYGMTIQPHTVTHPDLTALTPEQQRKEMADSKAEVESKLGTQVKFFCYPYGKFNSATLKQLKDSGYKLGLTISQGKANPADNLLLLKRLYVNGFHDLQTFKKRLGT